MLLNVYKPSTAFVIVPDGTKFFQIYDQYGVPYYFRHLDGETRIRFNIVHNGSYTFPDDCHVKIKEGAESPIFLPDLPKPDRNRIKNVRVERGDDNEGLALIYTDAGIIKVSEEFDTLPAQVRGFLLYHEYGHLLYSKEDDCDLFALVASLRKGYNRSMCFYAMSHYLSMTDENIERIKKIFDHIQYTQRKKLL